MKKEKNDSMPVVFDSHVHLFPPSVIASVAKRNPLAEALFFEKMRRHNLSGKPPFFAIFDTFYQADRYFGAPRKHMTTPEKLRCLVTTFPEIDFVATHTGELTAPYREIEEHLYPQRNLYLETSNAAHVLSREEFVRLLDRHGPEHVIFGTDWPWFGHLEEIALIQGLLQKAGFSAGQQALVFSGNISGFLNK
jgi:predicted TIM-barrel fold metal-dependent hydrolase